MKKILLVSDVDNWAWHYKALGIQKYLKNYQIDIVYTHAEPNYRDSDLSKYDHIHIFGWYSIGERETPYLHKISTSIASIEFELLKPDQAKKILPKVSVVAVSEVLYKHLESKRLYKKLFACYNGVDEDKFYPDRQEGGGRFRVGLACKPQSKYDLHGLEIATKLKESLQKIDPDIELVMHIAKHKTAVSHEEMAKFYNTLDLFIHTGRFHLATPNPVFEAASCGVPVVGTTNGCIPLLIKDGFNGYLIDIELSDDQKVEKFVDYILKIKNSRELREKLGSNNRDEILRNWTWKQRAQDWIPVFECGKR
jgi:glycosyltransferase involved in cell wall biosynthesis